MSLIVTEAMPYMQTSVQLPLELVRRARELQINRAKLFRESLEKEIKRIENTREGAQ